MQLTFITLHDTTPQCNILYVSDSVTDILGYSVTDVLDRSTFNYFHPEDAVAARVGYRRSLESDQASVLCYARLRTAAGDWLPCECIYSCVGDILVATTTFRSISPRSEGRALAAEVVRRTFQSPEQDPRREMLVHISARSVSVAPNVVKEARTVLILNRFSRYLPILYSTHAIYDILGLEPAEIAGISFLDFIDPECVDGVVQAIDKAKENDSIAYMRFWWMLSENKDHDRPMNHTPSSTGQDRREAPAMDRHDFSACVEVETVVTCSSDGIIIVLRRALPSIFPTSAFGTYAVPWTPIPLSAETSTTTASSSDSARESTSKSCQEQAQDPTYDDAILDSVSDMAICARSRQRDIAVLFQPSPDFNESCSDERLSENAHTGLE